MNPANQILSQIKGEKSIISGVPLVMALHHIIMSTYGWIPLKEFKELPADTVLNLVDLISKDKRISNGRY